MVVTAVYDDRSTAAITNYKIDITGKLTPDNTAVVISYTENKVTKTVSLPITVKSLRTNPFTDETTTDSFWDLYEEALDKVFDAEALFLSDDFDKDAAERLTGNLNFSGMPVDPDSLDEPDE